jgi:hypothetical protein
MDVRTKKGMWSYVVRKEEVNKEASREDLLDLRSKIIKDKHCWWGVLGDPLGYCMIDWMSDLINYQRIQQRIKILCDLPWFIINIQQNHE